MSKTTLMKIEDLSVQMMIIVAHLCGSFLDHFQLTLVDLDTPKETIKEPEEDPTSQPEQTQGEKKCIIVFTRVFMCREKN